MVPRNQRKLVVLRVLDQLGQATLRELYEEFNGEVKLNTLQTNLNNYRSQGLIKRIAQGPFCYTLSEKGRNKLEWLQEHETIIEVAL